MKFKKILPLVIVGIMMTGALSACGGSTIAEPSSEPTAASTEDNSAAATETTPTEAAGSNLAELGLDENLRFTDTRKITVEVYDRNNDNGSAPDNNVYTTFIKEGLLRDHNIDVTFVNVPRWTETEEINNLLAAGTAPDVCVTYSYPTVQTYGVMGGVINMQPYLDENKDILPNLWGLLGDANIYQDRDPVDKHIWAVEALLSNNMRTNTFVREDWLKKLNIAEPTSVDEFEAMLKAFKDNAETLLGKDADKMVPFSIGYDVGWRADHLLGSYIPNDITDKDLYVNGFDDRRLLEPGIKEGVRKLNQWYNEGLIWKDFSLYSQGGDPTEDNMIKAGYVGAFAHNWDYPYRDGENGITANLNRLVGEDAAFIAVEPFKNDAGLYRKYLSPPIDRKVFFPSTNKEPVASLLYLDWISKQENRVFLQIGEEGVTHTTQPDGSISIMAATGDSIMNSPNNIDYTITINGLDLGSPELTVKSIAQGYAGVDPSYIEKAYAANKRDVRIIKQPSIGAVAAEEGMDEPLKAKRDVLFNTAIVASPDQFDAVFDAGMKDYLNSGGQAIIDGRAEQWNKFFGDATTY